MGKSCWARPTPMKSSKGFVFKRRVPFQAGVFGVPSFVVDGEIFWGNDRLHFLKAYLQGELPTNAAKTEEILARPRAADRPKVAGAFSIGVAALHESASGTSATSRGDPVMSAQGAKAVVRRTSAMDRVCWCL